MAFTAYGVSVGIRTNNADILDGISAYMPPEWEATHKPIVDSLFSLRLGPAAQRQGRRNYHLLYYGAVRIARSLDMAEILETLENYLRITVAFWAKEDHLFVHAGVVGWQDRAIVIPGRSFSGKTTLVSELIKSGATYYSDDMAIFDPQGRVHPFPVPLSVRQEDGRDRKQPEEFGSISGVEPLPVGLVIVTNYEEGAQWRPRTLSPGRTLMALLDNTVAARKDPKVSLPILQQVVRSASAFKSKRGEAATVAGPILAQLA